MKRITSVVWLLVFGWIGSIDTQAQNKVDDERMDRDIEIAENILGTLIKQEFDKKRAIFPIEIEGSYAPGYGVTFRVPTRFFGFGVMTPRAGVMWNDAPVIAPGFTYSYSTDEEDDFERELARKEELKSRGDKSYSKRKSTSYDSMMKSFDDKLIAASRNFIADYGDLISQLNPDEKIVITNKSEGQRVRIVTFGNEFDQSYLSIEGQKADINQFKQGKLTRDQLISRIKVVNSEIENELYPDRELLSSIFNRLYRYDLSKSYYTNESMYYEGLKGYGVTYYMQVYSSSEDDYNQYTMPTLRLKGLSQSERDKKVVELFPVFDKSIKEDMIEYGRTLKSLKENEMLIFNVSLTRCIDCGIPSYVEYSIKANVLNDYVAGKITKDAAVAKIATKRGPNQ